MIETERIGPLLFALLREVPPVELDHAPVARLLAALALVGLGLGWLLRRLLVSGAEPPFLFVLVPVALVLAFWGMAVVIAARRERRGIERPPGVPHDAVLVAALAMLLAVVLFFPEREIGMGVSVPILIGGMLGLMPRLSTATSASECARAAALRARGERAGA